MTNFGSILTDSAAPGGELGGTWASPTVDATHSGSAHADFLDKDGWTANRIIFADATGALVQDAGLTYDATNNVFAADKEIQVNDGANRLITAKSVFAGVGYMWGAVAAPDATNYAWAQSSAGATFLHSASGQILSFQVGGTTRAFVSSTAFSFGSAKCYPSTPAGAGQTAVGVTGNVGAPNNAQGANGDVYFRSDGGALTTMYQKRAGAWVGVV